MRGKNKCKILKEIRQRIADENDIPYVTRECSYQGECSGTCPRCEAELRYLEQQLARRQALGKTVTVAALAATLSLGLTGCVPSASGGKLQTDPAAMTVPQLQTEPVGTATEGEPVPDVLYGEVAPEPETTMGMVARDPEEIPTDDEPLTGDVVYLPNASLGDLPGVGAPDGESLPVETITPEPASDGNLGSNG